jgi:uncharacterized membrane protein YgaE (UPF0421/DUF939 family)
MLKINFRRLALTWFAAGCGVGMFLTILISSILGVTEAIFIGGILCVVGVLATNYESELVAATWEKINKDFEEKSKEGKNVK